MLRENPLRVAFERSLMKHGAYVLGSSERELVERVIRDHADVRGWRLHAVNVRTTHVHVIVTAPVPPEKAMGELKAWCTRRLREAGLATTDRKIWADHGSTRWLNDENSVRAAIAYVVEQQDDARRHERDKREAERRREAIARSHKAAR